MIEMPLFIKWRCVSTVKFNQKSQDPPSLIGRGAKAVILGLVLASIPQQKGLRYGTKVRSYCDNIVVRALPAGRGLG